MLQPKKQKHRKEFRRRSALHGKAKGGFTISFGKYALKAMTSGEATSRQIESARKAIMNYLKREGKLWISVFPHKPVTVKAAEVPMGSGKGSPDHFVAPINPGRIIFELDNVTEEKARGALRLASHKLPFDCKFLVKEF